MSSEKQSPFPHCLPYAEIREKDSALLVYLVRIDQGSDNFKINLPVSVSVPLSMYMKKSF